jgi:hypothetical protein
MTYILNQARALDAGITRAARRISRLAMATVLAPAIFVGSQGIALSAPDHETDPRLSGACNHVNGWFAGGSRTFSVNSGDYGWEVEGEAWVLSDYFTSTPFAEGEVITYSFTGLAESDGGMVANLIFASSSADWDDTHTPDEGGNMSGSGTFTFTPLADDFSVTLRVYRSDTEVWVSVEAQVTLTCTKPDGDPDPDPEDDSDTVAIEGQVQDFVKSRQGHLAANVRVPTLQDRRQKQDSEPVVLEFMPSSSHVAANAAASLATLGPDYSTPFNIWFDGTLALHNRPQNDGHWGRFGILNFGADYLVTNELLVGLSVHIDQMTDPSNTAVVSGTGWLVGPYVSTEVLPGVFWDANFVYGQSTNTIDSPGWTGTFGTTRKLFETSVKGTVALGETTTLTPRLAMFYISEDVGAYTLSDGKGGTVNVAGYTEEQLRASLGMELSRAIALDNGLTLTPTLGLSGGYAALGGPGAFGKVSAGLALETEAGFEITAGLSSTLDAQGAKTISANAGLSGGF